MLSLWLPLLLLGGVSDEPYRAWRADGVVEVERLPATVGQRLASDELAALAGTEPPLPFHELTMGVRLADGSLWVGSTGGLMWLEPGAERWRLFHSRRWLPDDRVERLAVDADGSVWVETPAGIGRLTRHETTLAAKIEAIHDTLREHHRRHGLIGAIHVNEPGNLAAGYTQYSDDNDGLWTCLYIAAEAYRYGTTGDESARRNARESFEALMFLEQVTGISGFVARSIVPGDEEDPKQRYGGHWYRSADDKWWWKGDTSSDELDGHYFAYAVYYDLVADESEKEEIRGYVARITDHILDHDYYYVGPDGKPTRWGVWAPEKLNRDLKWHFDRGLNSLELLSHLKVAEHIVGAPRYAEAARELNETHGYAINTVRQKMIWPPEEVNHSDDELAFLAYYPLVIYERDPELRQIYLASLQRSWEIERPERSPFFNYIYAAGRQASQWKEPSERPPSALLRGEQYDHEACVEWFREVPSDLFVWTVKNSARQDLGGTMANRFGRLRSLEVLPVSERPLMRWNGDPFELDAGADGRRRDDGTFILLPYWMGRYHRFLD